MRMARYRMFMRVFTVTYVVAVCILCASVRVCVYAAWGYMNTLVCA